MKMLLTIFALALFAALAYPLTYQNISNCSSLENDTYYTLNSSVNITPGFTCFSMSSVLGECPGCGNNITLDCNGFTVYGDNNGSTYGVTVSNSENDVVKNCIFNGSTISIDFESSFNGQAYNNTLYPDIVFPVVGIALYDSYNISLYENAINSVTSPYGYIGTEISGADTPANSYNNTLFNNTFIAVLNSTAVHISHNSQNNTFYWNNFSGSGQYLASDSIYANYLNTTMSGHGEGNIWQDVVNGSPLLTPSGKSLFGRYLAYSLGGTKYPYNSSNTAKLTGGSSDYAPLSRSKINVYVNGQSLGWVYEEPGAFTFSGISSYLLPNTSTSANASYSPEVAGMVNISNSTLFYIWQNSSVPYTWDNVSITPGTNGSFHVTYTYQYTPPIPLWLLILIAILPLLIAIALLTKVMGGINL